MFRPPPSSNPSASVVFAAIFVDNAAPPVNRSIFSDREGCLSEIRWTMPADEPSNMVKTARESLRLTLTMIDDYSLVSADLHICSLAATMLDDNTLGAANRGFFSWFA